MPETALRLLAVFLLLTALGGCGGTNGAGAPDDSTTVTSDAAPLPGSIEDDIAVSGPLGSDATWDPSTGEIQFDVVADSVGRVVLMDTSRDFGWTATYPYWFADLDTEGVATQAMSSGVVGPLSTAVDLLLLTPNIATRDAALLPEVIGVLRSVAEVQALASFLEVNADAADPIALPGFPVAYEAAIIAGVDAVDAAGLTPSQVEPASAFPVDQAFTTARESGGDVTVEWKSDVWPINRTLTHLGLIYEVDTASYVDESQLRAALINDGNSVAPALVSDAPVARITLPAEDPAAVIDVLGLAIDWVFETLFDLLEPEGLADVNEASLPEGAYMLQLQTCATMHIPGLLSLPGLANYNNDLVTIVLWPGTSALSNAANTCALMTFENAVDIVSLVVDIGDLVDSRVLLEDPWPEIWGEAADMAFSVVSSTTAEAWSSSDMRHLSLHFVQALLASATEIAAKASVKSSAKMSARMIASLLDLPGKLSTAASLTARSITAGGLTPLESTLIVVGRPWDTTSPPTYPLSISVDGSGTVVSSPAGIDCPGTCTADFEEGASVTLSATPSSGWTFDGWGGDADCDDGIVSMTTARTCTATFVESGVPSGVTFTAIATGRWSHSLALDSTGDAWAWGWDSSGQLGDGGANQSMSIPVRVLMPDGVSFVAIDGGHYFTLALDAGGDAWAWGDGLGDSSQTTNVSPVQVDMPVGVDFTAIAAGMYHALALDSEGNAWAWGSDSSGQLGDGGIATSMTAPVPVVMPAGVSFEAVAAGAHFSLALDTSGSAWAWGSDYWGQLGDGGSNQNRDTPVRVILPPGVTLDYIAAGHTHAVALDTEGNAWAWGQDYYGALGDGGSDTDVGSPVQVVMPSGVKFIGIAGGRYFSTAIAEDGAAWSWGSDSRLGDGGSNGHQPSPVQVVMPSGVAFVSSAASNSHTLALDTNGLAWAWGRNWEGQLGDGTNSDREAPVEVTMP